MAFKLRSNSPVLQEKSKGFTKKTVESIAKAAGEAASFITKLSPELSEPIRGGKESLAPTMQKKTAAWTRKEGKDPKGGLNAKGVASYRRENPGSKLQKAVTKKPSELKPGSKDAKRRKSFCARMSGMPGPMKDEKGRPTRKALSLRKWNC